jgi:hypothetical protein
MTFFRNRKAARDFMPCVRGWQRAQRSRMKENNSEENGRSHEKVLILYYVEFFNQIMLRFFFIF